MLHIGGAAPSIDQTSETVTLGQRLRALPWVFWGLLLIWMLVAAAGMALVSTIGLALLESGKGALPDLLQSNSVAEWRHAARTLHRAALVHSTIVLPLVYAPFVFWVALVIYRNTGGSTFRELLLTREAWTRAARCAAQELTEGEQLVAAFATSPDQTDSVAVFLAPLPLFLMLFHVLLPPSVALAIVTVLGDYPDGVPESAFNPVFVYGYVIALGLCVAVRLVRPGGGVHLGVSAILATAALFSLFPYTYTVFDSFVQLATHDFLRVLVACVETGVVHHTRWYETMAVVARMCGHLRWFWVVLFAWDLAWFAVLAQQRLLVVTSRRLLVFVGPRWSWIRPPRLRAVDTNVTVERLPSVVGVTARLQGGGFTDRVQWRHRSDLDAFCRALDQRGLLKRSFQRPRFPFGVLDLVAAGLTLALFTGWVYDYTVNGSSVAWEALLDAKLLPSLAAASGGASKRLSPRQRLQTAEFVLQLSPDKGAALLCKGDALRDLGRLHEAERVYRRLLRVAIPRRNKLRNAANARLWMLSHGPPLTKGRPHNSRPRQLPALVTRPHAWPARRKTSLAVAPCSEAPR